MNNICNCGNQLFDLNKNLEDDGYSGRVSINTENSKILKVDFVYDSCSESSIMELEIVCEKCKLILELSVSAGCQSVIEVY